MADLIVSRKVSLVKSWTEDIVTDEILNKIAAQAKAEKGKKLKIKISEAGVSLTRVRFFIEKETTFVPIRTVKAVMQTPGYPRCVLLILSDPEKKYKIVALRCESDVDAAKLTNFFAEVQNRGQADNVEFIKRENGNWSLRGRTDHNSNKVLTEILSEHKQSNGDVRTGKTNGDVTHVPIIDARERSKNELRAAGVSASKDEGDKKTDSDADYVIEAEVEEHHPARIHTKQERHVVRSEAPRSEHDVIEEAPYNIGKPRRSRNYSQASLLPSRPVVKRLPSSTLTLPQPVVYRAPSQPVVYAVANRTMEPVHPIVYRTSSRGLGHSQPVVYRTSSRGMGPSQPVVYAASSRGFGPLQPVVYTATSTETLAQQPDGHNVSLTPYPSEAATVTSTSAGFFTNPWAIRQISRESPFVPLRINSNPSGIQFDQQSLMSNTSRLSRFSRLRASETSIPTTVERSIENVYPRPNVFVRPSGRRSSGQKARPASYHANELRVYYEEEAEAVFH